MAAEIERKFIAEVDFSLLAAGQGFLRQQGYLSATADTEHRISVYPGLPGTGCYAIKTGSGLVREELEYAVSDDFTATLFRGINPSHVITKLRFEKDRWEIDIFLDKLMGLMIAEIELVSEDEPLPPVPAGLMLYKEVTDDRRYKNKNLAFLTRLAAMGLVQETFAI